MKRNRKEGYLAPLILPACKKGLCSKCAVKHSPDVPHNVYSLYYKYYFYNETGRWPSWEDAMAHCDEDSKEAVRELLKKKGINTHDQTRMSILRKKKST